MLGIFGIRLTRHFYANMRHEMRPGRFLLQVANCRFSELLCIPRTAFFVQNIFGHVFFKRGGCRSPIKP